MDNRLDPLSDQAFNLILKAAQMGWSPLDLLHILGKEAHGIIYRAAIRVPARISSNHLRREWLHFDPPARLRARKQSLAKCVRLLSCLPAMKDTAILGDAFATDDNSRSGMGSRARVQEKIRRLLDKAESTTFEHEAAALVERAQLLQQRHRLHDLSMADRISTADGTGEHPDLVRSLRIHLHPPYIKHQLGLLSAIAQANGCSCVLVHPAGVACILGEMADARYTSSLFESLNRQCDFFMRQGPSAEEASTRGQCASYRRSFRSSYATRIAQLLTDANSRGATVTPDSEEVLLDRYGFDAPGGFAQTPILELAPYLVLLEQRQLLAEAARDRLFPDLTSFSLRIGDWTGARDGLLAADNSHWSGCAPNLEARRELSA